MSVPCRGRTCPETWCDVSAQASQTPSQQGLVSDDGSCSVPHFVADTSCENPLLADEFVCQFSGSGLRKRCFWKTVFLPPTENRWFWGKMAKMTVYILPTKTRGCAPRSPETDENDENGGCPSDKTRVCQKQGFRHPDWWSRSFALWFTLMLIPDLLEIPPLVSVWICHFLFRWTKKGCHHLTPKLEPPDFLAGIVQESETHPNKKHTFHNNVESVCTNGPLFRSKISRKAGRRSLG